MIFKRFNPDFFKTDMTGKVVKTNVIFVDEKSLLRFGYVTEYVPSEELYIFSNGEYYRPTEDTLFCEAVIGELK